MNPLVPAAAAMMLLAAPAAHSQIVAQHNAAPLADEITFANVSECATGQFEVAVYLSGSVGELLVDSPASSKVGPVINVRVSDSGLDETSVEASDDTIFVSVKNLAPGQGVVVTVNLDSELDDFELSHVRSHGALIEGAEAVVSTPANSEWVGLFGNDGRALIKTSACLH